MEGDLENVVASIQISNKVMTRITIWAGYDENITIEQEEFHKDMYAAIMNRIVNEQGYWGGQFLWPAGIVQASVCHKSGKLPEDWLCDYDPTGKGTYMEYFEEGTVPTDYCDVHLSAYICSVSGLLANEYCPGYYQVCILRPDDIKGGPPRGYTYDSNFAYPGIYCDLHNAATAAGAGETEEDEGEGEETLEEEYYEEEYYEEY